MGVIYKITSPTGRVYVGKTKRPKIRVWEYRWRSKKRKSIVHDSIKGYGWEAHKFEIIEESDNCVLNEREIFWIKELNTFYLDNPLGMNMTRGGDGGGQPWMHDIERRKKQSERFKGTGGTFYGKTHTEESRKLISKLAKERNLKDGRRVPDWGAKKGMEKVMRPVIVYDNNGGFISSFKSLTEAASVLNIKTGSVKDSLKHGSWASGKYMFKYDDGKQPSKIEVGVINVKTERRPIYLLDDDCCVLADFDSAKEASEFFGIPKTTINRAAMYNNYKPIRSGHIFVYQDVYERHFGEVVNEESVPYNKEVACE